ncbi:MAG: hypothetical protein PHH86_11205, partial [Sphaerochaetaceae bacterium]|nr:hypothetical protein [Sphaerochaetaceae bacterium]
MRKLPIVFHQYKKSIFFRFLALIFALVSSLLLLFSYFYYDIISDGYEKQSHAVNQSLLYQIADNIESSIEFIERKIISIGENKYAVNAAIQPG